MNLFHYKKKINVKARCNSVQCNSNAVEKQVFNFKVHLTGDTFPSKCFVTEQFIGLKKIDESALPSNHCVLAITQKNF